MKTRHRIWLAATGVLVVALISLQGFAASKLMPELNPIDREFWQALFSNTDQRFSADSWSEKAAFARLLLQAGQSNSASEIFQDAWSTGDHATWSRGRVAWYIGLAELQAGRTSNANTWFSTASQSRLSELNHSDRESLRYLGLEGNQAGARYLVAFQAPADQPTTASLQEVAKYLRLAQREYDDKSIVSRVRLATWLLLFGEMTATNPDLCFCSSSLDAFHEGFSLLDQVTKDLAANAELARELEKDPAQTIRFDTAFVRQQISREREQLARQEERARLNQLRQLCLAYKQTVEQFADAEFAFLLGERENTRQSHEQVLQNIAATDRIVAMRSDYFLFDDEPDLTDVAEFSTGSVKPVAFSNQTISMVKSVHALATYQQARNAPADVGSKLNDESRAWAEAALNNDKAIAKLPSGADESNLLATFVAAATRDQRGRMLAFDPSPEVRQTARDEFVKARGLMEKVIAAIQERPQVQANSQLASAVNELAQKLKSPQSAQAVVDGLIAKGDKALAGAEVAEASKRFFSPDFALQALEMRRQQGISSAQLQSELDGFRAIGLVDSDSPEHALVESRLIVQQLGAQLAKAGIPSKGAEEQIGMLSKLALLDRRLRSAASSAKNPDLIQQLNAQVALTTAYGVSLEQNATPDRRVQEAFRLAQDASAYFDERLKRATLREQDRAAYIDSLIAARVAVGYLGIAVLPSHREEGLVSLAAAVDYSASATSVGSGLDLIGTPLLLAITRRDPSGSSQLAAEEREQRQLMTRFVEAALTMELGEPAAAAEQMRQALSQGSSSSGTPAQLRARDLARDADGFEAAGNLGTTMAAFRVLTEVKADNAPAALAAALDMIDSKPAASLAQRLAQLSDRDLAKLVSSLESPIASVALALAAEAYAAMLPVEEVSRERTSVLNLARLATSRSQELLSAPRLAQRYTHLVAMSNSAHQRLGDAQYYVAAANESLTNADYASSRRHARDGLARHPEEHSLWTTLLQAEIKHSQIRKLNRDELSRVARLTDSAFQRGVLTSFHRDYYLGLLEEQLGNRAKAIAGFESAVANATEASQRVQAKSKSARLRATEGTQD